MKRIPVIFVWFCIFSDVFCESENLDGYVQKTFMVASPLSFTTPEAPISITTAVSLPRFVNDTKISNLVLFSVSYQGHLNTWSAELEPGQTDVVVTKTLCYTESSFEPTSEPSEYSSDPSSEPSDIYIVVYSRTINKLKLDITAQKNELFHVNDNTTIQVNANSFSSQVFQYNFQNNEAVFVTIESLSDPEVCLVVGINKIGCPWSDTNMTIKNSQIWSRILNLGYFTVEAAEFPGGFQLTLLTLQNSKECIHKSHKKNPKVYSVSAEKLVSLKIDAIELKYFTPVAISVFLIFVFAIIFTGMWLAIWWWWKTELDESGEKDGVTPQVSYNPEDPGNECEDNAMINGLVEALDNFGAQNEGEEMTGVKAAVRRLRQQSRHELTLDDMSVMVKTSIWHRRIRSMGYLLVVPLLCLFYLIPSFQLVYAEWVRADESGSRDRCYHNHGCAKPYGNIPDFNHTISNLGYIIYGLIFICIVFLKSRIVPSDNQPNVDHTSTTGIIQQYSIFYTLGFCMIFQGIFSGIFHICPSNFSLQFDTSMMYMIMVLVFMKTFQFRHPDTSIDVFTSMYSFCVLLFLESASLYITGYGSKIAFHAFCGILYLGLIVYLSITNYFYGAIQVSFSTTLPIVFENLCEKARHPFRLKMMLTFFLINLLLVIGLFSKVVTSDNEVESLSTPILLLCAANVALYLFQYLFRKFHEICRYSETCGSFWIRLSLLLVFLILFLSVGVVAGYFYANKLQSRNLTPAESRNMNAPCLVGDFFDNHDLWHFFSSTALFLAFIFLLTIDDDLFNIRRNEIKIF